MDLLIDMQSSRILQNFPLRKTPQRGPTVHPGAPLHGNLKGELRALKEAMEAMEAMQAEDSASKSGRKKKNIAPMDMETLDSA